MHFIMIASILAICPNTASPVKQPANSKKDNPLEVAMSLVSIGKLVKDAQDTHSKRKKILLPTGRDGCEESEHFIIKYSKKHMFDWRHCLEDVPVDQVNDAVSALGYIRQIPTTSATIDELSQQATRLVDTYNATATIISAVHQAPVQEINDIVEGHKPKKKKNIIRTVTDLADVLNWYHDYNMRAAIKRQPIFLIPRYVMDNCNMFSDSEVSLSRFFQKLLKIRVTTLFVGSEPLPYHSGMLSAVENNLVHNLFSFQCSDLDPPLGVPASPHSRDHHIIVLLKYLYSRQSIVNRLIYLGGDKEEVETFRSAQGEAMFLLPRFAHLRAGRPCSQNRTDKLWWERLDNTDHPRASTGFCYRCADNCTHRQQETLILSLLKDHFNLSMWDWIEHDCKPTLYLGYSHVPEDKNRQLLRHTKAIYDTDEIVMLTRKPNATEPQNDVGHSLDGPFQLEALYVVLGIGLISVVVSPYLCQIPSTFIFLLSMLVHSRELTCLRTADFCSGSLVCAWAFVAFLTITEFNSQLLFVLQNPRVDHYGGESLLNTTLQLNDAVRRSLEKDPSYKIATCVNESNQPTRDRICFVDEVSTMFLSSENFTIPLTPYTSKAKDLAEILQVSRQEWLEYFAKTHAAAVAQEEATCGPNGNKSCKRPGSKASYLNPHSLRSKELRFVISRICGLHDAEIYIRMYRRGYLRDPKGCVEQWQKRLVYPFGLRKVIQRSLSSLPLSSYVEHVFSPEVTTVNIYPTSDATSPYAKWFDRLFTRLTEDGLFHKAQKLEFLNQYRLEVAIMERDDWKTFAQSVILFSEEKTNRRCSYQAIAVKDNPFLFWLMYVVYATSILLVFLERIFPPTTMEPAWFKLRRLFNHQGQRDGVQLHEPPLAPYNDKKRDFSRGLRVTPTVRYVAMAEPSSRISRSRFRGKDIRYLPAFLKLEHVGNGWQ